MKKQAVSLLLFLSMLSCKSEKGEKVVETDIPTENSERDSLSQGHAPLPLKEDKKSRNISGIYEYVYEYNTKKLVENHYMDLKTGYPSISGIYYGTSDDFDEAREEYLPGFFKSIMRNVKLTDSTFNFTLTVQEKDFYINPITPLYEVKNNKPWEVGIRYNEREYQGKIIGDTIIIKTKDFDPRKFVKKK